MKDLAKVFAGAVGLAALVAGAPALAADAHSSSLSVTVDPFGKMPDGQAVQKYRLDNANGTPNSVGVELTLFSPNGDMGYPGDLAVTVRYTLDNDNDLRIHYAAVSDQPTVLNLTNHTYYNLAGAGSGTVLDQVAMINADKNTPVDDTLIPTGKMMDVTGTPLGFTTPTAIGANIHADNQQLKFAEPKQGGYDFNYVFNNPGDLGALAASVTDPKSGRTIEMYTDQPSVQFYTSNFLNDVHGKDGKVYPHWGAFTLEAQHFPDSPNQANFPSTELKPGEKYSQTTIYKFLPVSRFTQS